VIGVELLETGLALGAIALLAGCYGACYIVGRLAGRQSVLLAGYGCYALQCAATALLIAAAPLEPPWKLLILVSTLGFFGVPPMTWRLLEGTHGAEKHPAG
jgi:hypothetical protein